MDFFTNPDILLGDKLLEILYIVMGLVLIYTGVRNLTDKTNPHRYGSALFLDGLRGSYCRRKMASGNRERWLDLCDDHTSNC
ncbi:hypothetical protein EfmAA818_07130 [Enterococcus faecium]|nr:hypothetical protein EfmAA818_07130 [Enterococcus faecium]